MTTDNTTIEKKPFKINLSLVIVVGTFIATSGFWVGGWRVTKDQPVNEKITSLNEKLDTFGQKADQLQASLQTVTDNQKATNEKLAFMIQSNSYRLEAVEGVVAPPQGASCEQAVTCGGMRSPQEVYYYYLSCKKTNLDYDNDGIPCNQQLEALRK